MKFSKKGHREKKIIYHWKGNFMLIQLYEKTYCPKSTLLKLFRVILNSLNFLSKIKKESRTASITFTETIII